MYINAKQNVTTQINESFSTQAHTHTICFVEFRSINGTYYKVIIRSEVQFN
jgi:hypothetical protein